MSRAGASLVAEDLAEPGRVEELNLWEYDWDEGNISEVRAHGIEPDEWEEAFEGPTIGTDAYGKPGERRYGFTGRVWPGGRIITGIYTERVVDGVAKTRPITAWNSTERQKSRYRSYTGRRKG